MAFDSSAQARLAARLQQIYGARAPQLLPELLQLMESFRDLPRSGRATRWDQRDVVLITYGDQVRDATLPALEALRAFLADHRLHELINTVHLLPFYPYSSDDGFSVIDYLSVSPDLGTWDDIARLAGQHELMFDLVLNHISRDSEWFRGYLRGDARYRDHFIEMDPATDLSLVTRPRSLPLLNQYETSRGPRHLWTTFSADQIDLNYAQPQVLLDVLRVMLCYIRRGARMIRLDAIAYLWKEVGTRCIHLPQTHGIVQLMREILDILAPHVILLTETNVPHRENISYFGAGDEAHLVYQFSLPPLLADALLRQDASQLHHWLTTLDVPPPGTTYFNFTASHDGVGVRPLEGLLPPELRQQLVESALARGGLVSTRRSAEGTDTPYELNITYFDLLGDQADGGPAQQVPRFLASQALMLSLRGVPGVYFHSLVGTPNDAAGARSSGVPRRINRRKFTRAELDLMLRDPGAAPQRLFQAYKLLLAVRTAQAAFHPDGEQEVLPLVNPRVLKLLRIAPDGRQKILVVANLSGRVEHLDVAPEVGRRGALDLLTNRFLAATPLQLGPFEVVWLHVGGAGS